MFLFLLHNFDLKREKKNEGFACLIKCEVWPHRCFVSSNWGILLQLQRERHSHIFSNSKQTNPILPAVPVSFESSSPSASIPCSILRSVSEGEKQTYKMHTSTDWLWEEFSFYIICVYVFAFHTLECQSVNVSLSNCVRAPVRVSSACITMYQTNSKQNKYINIIHHNMNTV